MKVKKEGAIAAGALLGVNVACVNSLITVTATTPIHDLALLCFAVSIPFLSYGVSVELLQLKSPYGVHAYMLFMGAAAGIAGFGCFIGTGCLGAGLVFGIISLMVIGLTALRHVK